MPSANSPVTTWTPVEISLAANRRPANPYTDLTVTGTFEHESGETHDIPGFWDGGRDWWVRFAPTLPGRWEYRIESDSDGDGLSDSGWFDANESVGSNPMTRHGFLSTDGRRLVHDDGTPFAWLADTAWSAGAKAMPAEWDEYLTARAEQGFNVVQVNALPQWDASRPWDRLPFGEDWDLDRPDPAYFRALDKLVAATHDRGLVPALVAVWFNYAPGTWPEWDGDGNRHPMDAEQAARWGRYLAARYGAFGTVWLISGDTNYEDDRAAALDVFDAAGSAIGESVTHPLRTTHMVGGQSTPEHVAERDWVEFHLYQSSHVTDRALPAEMAVECRSRDGSPVINGEPPYERHEYFDDDGVRISRRAAREAAWLSVLAGANAGITYGGHGIWQWHRNGEHFAGLDRTGMPDPWDETLAFPGARDYAELVAYLSRFAYGSLEPRQDLLVEDPDLTRAAVLPEDDMLLVYAAEASDVALDADAVADADCHWLDPATMTRVPATVDAGDPNAVVSAPPWRDDALLECCR